MGETVASIRTRLFGEQKGRCYYCRCHLLDSEANDDRAATLDHRVPRALRGPTHYANAVCACRKCNRAKGDMSEEAFLRLLRRSGHRPAKKRRPVDESIAAARQARKAKERRQMQPHPVVLGAWGR